MSKGFKKISISVLIVIAMVVSSFTGISLSVSKAGYQKKVFVIHRNVRPLDCPPDVIFVNKTVWNGTEWVKEINASVGDTVRFNITILNTGPSEPVGYVLYNILVNDTLPDGLQYSDNATVDGVAREPDVIANNTLIWNITDRIVLPGEGLYIEFDATVLETGLHTNVVNVTSGYCNPDIDAVYGESEASVNVSEKVPGRMRVSKTVWNGTTWVKEINASVGETVRFNITISYSGNYTLYNIKVRDELPDCLEYADNAEPEETNIIDNVVYWNLTETLHNDEAFSIEFDALVISNGTNVNLVNVTANECSGAMLYGEDTAIVNAKKPGKPILEVEKEVWNGDSWVKEASVVFGENVRFRITVRNQGNATMFNVTITDQLPNILKYVSGSANIDPNYISPDNRTIKWIIPWMFPGESRIIEFEAKVISCGVGITANNTVNITAKDCTGNHYYAEDHATIRIVTDNTPPTSTINPLPKYWYNTYPINITANATDDISGVARVELWYIYKVEQGELGIIIQPLYPLVDDDPSDGWKWEFDFPHGEGHYEFYTIAIDNAGNRESEKNKSRISCGYDVTKPTSTAIDPSDYWFKDIVTINANASDNMSGIKQIELFYRYSNDNSTWTPWKLYGTDNNPSDGWKWQFDASKADGDGHYQVYTIATDNAGNTQEAPTTAQADFGIDTTAPTLKIVKPEEGYLYIFDHKIMKSLAGITRIIGKITIEVDAEDATTGVEEIMIKIDNETKAVLTEEPYKWVLNEKIRGSHLLTVIAKDKVGNINICEMYIKILKIFGSSNGSSSANFEENNNDNKPTLTLNSENLKEKNSRVIKISSTKVKKTKLISHSS